MAIATNGGHVSRALDFYHTEGKYFIIGGTKPWTHEKEGQIVTDDSTPRAPLVTDFKLDDVVGLKRVDHSYLVVPDENGTIQYRKQNWRIVDEDISTTVKANVAIGAKSISVVSVAGMRVGNKLRIGNEYDGVITNISSTTVTLDVGAPVAISAGSPVIGGAMIEGAKYVYVDCYLNYDEFPLVTYRQIGLCTRVTPDDKDIMRAKDYTVDKVDEFNSLGLLEIIDNRRPSTRDIDQRELLSLIIEF